MSERRCRGERGASLVEYALLVALIAGLCMGAVAFFGGESGSSLTNSCQQITAQACE